ncbi:MAG: tetratricopeptide repeat protein [Anaerolineae bacterium]|nr:tetratricopeptide repeat protein [Anaerolineae bacterium]
MSTHSEGAVKYNQQGSVHLESGEYDLAIEAFSKAICLAPGYVQALTNRGNAYADKQLTDRAIADYDEAIRLNPEYATAFNNRGNTYFQKQEYDRAIADYDEAIRLNPEDADAFYNRGNAYAIVWNYAAAARSFEIAVKLDGDMWTYVKIAGCYRQLGDVEQVEYCLALARPLLPEQNAYDQACYAAIAGNRERALDLLTKVLHDDPTQKAWAALNPDFAFIRDDPRFQALIT